MTGMAQEHTCSIYIMPYKIQKQRLRDIKSSLNRKKLQLSNSAESATYIVSEYETLEQVKEQMRKDHMTCRDDASIVTMKWLVECLKASQIVMVEENHKVKQAAEPLEDQPLKNPIESSEWACQRGATISNPNKIFCDALELLQLHAELRDANQDYSRALAFRRASCVLKSFPIKIKNIHQLEGFKDIGSHATTVIADLIDQGYSEEVEGIRNSEWFKMMKLFTSVFGIGPSTAKKWIEKGWTSIEDVIASDNYGSDWRVSWGLAFFSDLNKPVSLFEAKAFLNIVKKMATDLLPGIIVTLVGGFRRGKTNGHDVDILLSHPEEGKELGILAKLLRSLEKKGLLLLGHSEKNSFRSEILYQDFKLSMRGQLDHFEKWLGICKFPNSFQEEPTNSSANACAMGSPKTGDSSAQTPTKNSLLSDPKIQEKLDPEVSGEETELKKLSKRSHASSLDESLDDSFEPLLKKSRQEGNPPLVLSKQDRDWTARRVDLIVSPYSQYFYALVGWTGSKHFNRDARLYAQKTLGMKLTSHGLYNSKQQKSIPANSEEEVFSHLNIPYRQPTERNC